MRYVGESKVDRVTTKYICRVLCLVDESNPLYDESMRGAYAVVCCVANSITTAVALIKSEFSKFDLTLAGFDYLHAVQMLDRELSEYEEKLIEAAKIYPVQYKNVHYFPDLM